MIRWLLAACALAAWCGVEARPIASGYDAHFQRSCARWLPAWEWQWCKAQCVAESGLNPLAVSPVGAQGLCQFMPGTWGETRAGLGWKASASPFTAELAIEAAAYYDARIRAMWSGPRTEPERRRLVFASYNAGAGHILRAQRKCGGPNDWPAIAGCLPMITGPANARETTGYVARIERIYLELTR